MKNISTWQSRPRVVSPRRRRELLYSARQPIGYARLVRTCVRASPEVAAALTKALLASSRPSFFSSSFSSSSLTRSTRQWHGNSDGSRTARDDDDDDHDDEEEEASEPPVAGRVRRREFLFFLHNSLSPWYPAFLLTGASTRDVVFLLASSAASCVATTMTAKVNYVRIARSAATAGVSRIENSRLERERRCQHQETEGLIDSSLRSVSVCSRGFCNAAKLTMSTLRRDDVVVNNECVAAWLRLFFARSRNTCRETSRENVVLDARGICSISRWKSAHCARRIVWNQANKNKWTHLPGK